MDVIKEIDRRVVLLAVKEKTAKTKILKAQYSASQTSLVMLKMWINQNNISLQICSCGTPCVKHSCNNCGKLIQYSK